MTKKDFEECAKICARVIYLTRKRARREIVLSQFTSVLGEAHDNFDIMKFTVCVSDLLQGYAEDEAIDAYIGDEPQ